jgi:hypothetical protein
MTRTGSPSLLRKSFFDIPYETRQQRKRLVLNGLTATIKLGRVAAFSLSFETVNFDLKPGKIRVPGGRYLQMKLDLVIKIPDVKVYGKAQDFTIFNGKVYDPERVVQLMAISVVGDLIVRSFDAHYEDQVKDRVKKAWRAVQAIVVPRILQIGVRRQLQLPTERLGVRSCSNRCGRL